MTNKQHWPRVAFGDVVRQVKDKVDAKSSGLSRYVAGQHMKTDDLRIREWGEINDDYLGPAFHMRFKPSQVLYGSRRTYLRKVAVPHFEGICANTTFVLESKDPHVLLPELLPFIMQTEAFHDHSIKQSKGSVNPYVNFSDLTWYEFALPPLDEQRRIAQLCNASYQQIETLKEAQAKHQICEQSLIDSLYSSWEQTLRSIPLDKLLASSPESGCSAPSRDNETGYWVLALSALSSSGYVADEIKPVDATAAMLAAKLNVGDLLISRSNTRERVGFVGIYNGELLGNISFPDTMMRLHAEPSVTSNPFLELLLQTTPARRQIMSIAAGTSASMKKINRRTLLKRRFPIPTIEEQRGAIALKANLRKTRKEIKERLNNASELHRSFLSTYAA